MENIKVDLEGADDLIRSVLSKVPFRFLEQAYRMRARTEKVSNTRKGHADPGTAVEQEQGPSADQRVREISIGIPQFATSCNACDASNYQTKFSGGRAHEPDIREIQFKTKVVALCPGCRARLWEVLSHV